MEKRKPLSRESNRLLRAGLSDVKAGRVSTPLTEKRVRELILDEMAKATPWTFIPASPPVEPCTPTIPPSIVAYACGFPSMTVLYMAQTYEPPQGWTSATVTFTRPTEKKG